METESIDLQLREALTHIWDPDQSPPPAMWELVGCDPDSGILAFQSALVDAISDLKPGEDAPRGSRMERLHKVLESRFVQQLTLEETAEQMHLSSSSVWRIQQEAVHALARALWGKSQARTGEIPSEPHTQQEDGEAQGADWRSQALRELASLQASDPNAVSDVTHIIESVLSMELAMSRDAALSLSIASLQPDLVAAIHPSILRQILITTIRRVAQHSKESIEVFSRSEDGRVRITIASTLTDSDGPDREELVSQLVIPEEVVVSVQIQADRLFLWIDLPTVGTIPVLVVDDNVDMLRFFRRCTERTQYYIRHLAEARNLFQSIESLRPAIIVLDIMLPDVDGWELLTRLHENPETRDIPVIVCSVVREEKLALSLGASHYLAKPVRPAEFKQALDQVLAQSS